LAVPLKQVAIPKRQVLAWLQPRRPEWFEPSRFPVFNLAVDEGRYYGLPVFEVPGFKFGRYHHRGETFSTADHLRRASLTRKMSDYCPNSPRATFLRALDRPWRCVPACLPTRSTNTSSSIAIRHVRR